MGKLFSITKYGSETLLRKLDHQRIIAITIPIPVPSKKPISVSLQVTLMCINKSLEDKFIKVFKILLGWLIIKLSISPFLAVISQTAIKAISILICVKNMLIFVILFFIYRFSMIDPVSFISF